ncbi:MAG: hypothetical protein IKV25_02665 [Clostridia bacterium]|nr:hypothetical protein [Clostridia bacterium]
MKKVLALVLVLVMLVSTSVIAFANSPGVGGGNGSDEISWDDIVNAGYSKGDYNRDGKISAYDARLAIQAAAEVITPKSADIKLCDFNGDGKITAYDAREILKIAAEQ